MAFIKGVSGNPKLKPIGKQNVITSKVKDAFGNLLKNDLERLQSDIDKLSPKDRLAMLLL